MGDGTDPLEPSSLHAPQGGLAGENRSGYWSENLRASREYLLVPRLQENQYDWRLHLL